VTRPQLIIVPGVSYFITAVIVGRQPVFLDAANCRTVVDALAFQRQQGKVELFAFVVMPDHMHWILQPRHPHTVTGTVRDFKTFTAKAIRNAAIARHNSRMLAVFAFGALRRQRQGFKIWQDDSWTEPITRDIALHSRIEYIHANPVRAGLVESTTDYPWSSARTFAGLPGVIEIDPLPF
jgi:putative transposase